MKKPIKVDIAGSEAEIDRISEQRLRLFTRRRVNLTRVLMAQYGEGKWKSKRSLLIATVNFLLFLLVAVSADRGLKMPEVSTLEGTRRSLSDQRRDLKSLLKIAKTFLWQSDGSGYEHVWPVSGLDSPDLLLFLLMFKKKTKLL